MAKAKFKLDHAALADALLPAVLEAGRVEMAAWNDAELLVSRKPDDSPVTEADHEAEHIIVAALETIAPDVLVIGEESCSQVRAPDHEETFFLVDPLDGTRNFVEHLPEFTVNVALIEAGRPVFGMIYAPATHALFATVGADMAVEADINCGDNPDGLGSCKTSELSTRIGDKDDLVAFASRSHTSGQLDELLSGIGVCRKKTPMGSSLKFCLIARGDGDIYVRYGETSEWDTAAGEAILSAAGGAVTTFDGGTLSYGRADKSFHNPPFVAWGDRRLIRAL